MKREITEGTANYNNWQRDNEANPNSWKILLPNNIRKWRSLKNEGIVLLPPLVLKSLFVR